MASPSGLPVRSVGFLQTLPGRNELLWGAVHPKMWPRSALEPLLAPVCFQWCLCGAPARQPHRRGQRGCSLWEAHVGSFSGSASPWMAPLGAVYLMAKARDSASRGRAPEVETFAHEQVAPSPPPCLTLDVLPAAKGTPAEHQVLLQPHTMQPLHLPDGGADPPGLRLRR